MPTTDQDLRALTYLARRLRDETHGCRQWDEAGTFACFKDALAGQQLLDVVQRVVGHATDATAQTPGAIRRPFTPDPAASAPVRARYDPAQTCATCGETREACRSKWHDDHAFVAVDAWRATPRTTGAAAVLAVVAEASAGLCEHRLAPTACAICRPRPEPKPLSEGASKVLAQLDDERGES